MYKIYLIRSINPENYIQWKVGISKHPEKRLKQLKTGNPNQLTIDSIYNIDERNLAYKTEALIHILLKEFKIDGEWFMSYSLNTELFFIYCEKYVKIAKILIKIKEDKNGNKN